MAALAANTGGCNSILNSWLDPTQVGSFSREGTLEIRSALSIQDSPLGIAGATEPVAEDLVPVTDPYRLEAGDTINVRIFELVVENTETTVQASLDEEGMISLPILGSSRAGGLTVRELEGELADVLKQREILAEAQVIVEPVVKRGQTYTIYGTIQNPSLYPISRPDTHLLEAINMAGGLLDTVMDIYVMRKPEQQSSPAVGSRSPPRPRHSLKASQAAGNRLTMSDGLQDPPAPPATRQADLTTQTAPSDGPLDRVIARPDAEREVIGAVIRGEPETAPGPTSPAVTSPAAEAITAEPAAQPRFVFLNGKWIEVKQSASQPQTERARVEETTAPPEASPQPPEQGKPVVDWGQIAGDTEQRIIHVSPDGLREGDSRQNIVVRPGDSIRLASGEVGEYYIMGQVTRPGAYSVTGRQITLKQAVASAGNIAPLGWPDRCTVYRRYGDREEMKQVNLDAIFAGKQADLFLRKDDLIVVGTHPVAPFLAVLRNAFRMTYGFGFVYDRNFADIDSYGSRLNPDFRQPRFPNLFSNRQ